MDRREFLAYSTPFALPGAAGCFSPFGRTRTKLADVSLLNLHDQPHSVAVRIERTTDGELLFEEEFDLKRAAEMGTSENPAPVIHEPWMDEAGRYRIAARLDDGAASESLRVPVPERPGPCYWVVVRVHVDGRLETPYDERASGCS